MLRAFLFDVYGTLLDVHSAIGRAWSGPADTAQAISRTWRAKQLEYTWTGSLRADYHSFRLLTEAALDFALAAHASSADSRQRAALLKAYLSLSPFADTVPALVGLKARGLRLAALSNGDPAMLESGLRNAGCHELLDAVLSVASLRIYKPARAVYELGRAWFNAPAGDIAFVSANAWDAAGAAQFGFQVYWLNRSDQPSEYGLDSAVNVHRIETLTEILA